MPRVLEGINVFFALFIFLGGGIQHTTIFFEIDNIMLHNASPKNRTFFLKRERQFRYSPHA